MFECVGGMREFSKPNSGEDGKVEDSSEQKEEGCLGCILADDMVSVSLNVPNLQYLV